MIGKPLQLEFARRGNARRVAALLLIGGVFLACYLGYEYRDCTHVLAGLDYRLRELKQRALAAPVARSAAQVAQEQSELKMMRQVDARLSLPWEALFNEIEATVDEQVTLLNIEPDAEKGVVLLTAEAKDLGAMLAYGKRLATSARFKDALIQSHQVQVQDPHRPVRFVVAAQWAEAPGGQ